MALCWTRQNSTAHPQYGCIAGKGPDARETKAAWDDASRRRSRFAEVHAYRSTRRVQTSRHGWPPPWQGLATALETHAGNPWPAVSGPVDARGGAAQNLISAICNAGTKQTTYHSRSAEARPGQTEPGLMGGSPLKGDIRSVWWGTAGGHEKLGRNHKASHISRTASARVAFPSYRPGHSPLGVDVGWN